MEVSSAYKEAIRDSLLCNLEFIELINIMNSQYKEFNKSKYLDNFQKYSVHHTQLANEYVAELLKMNTDFIGRHAELQKKFLSDQNANEFATLLAEKVEIVNNDFNKIRDISMSNMVGSVTQLIKDKIDAAVKQILNEPEDYKVMDVQSSYMPLSLKQKDGQDSQSIHSINPSYSNPTEKNMLQHSEVMSMYTDINKNNIPPSFEEPMSVQPVPNQ